ncbi:hypothetical protein [Maribellus mangrovi]|uniref:hypothetical protein n=1 Tax=Maribellus mangrovi TaxID=3133146 RepID=UPI0030ED338F
MENKKLLKFLLKDIAKIEELFAEKGSTGFDDYELEFLQSRFKAAKQIIQILEDKEGKSLNHSSSVEPVNALSEQETLIETSDEKADTKEENTQAPEIEEPVAAKKPEDEEVSEVQTVVEEIEEVKEEREEIMDEAPEPEDENADTEEILETDSSPEENKVVSNDDVELEEETEELNGRTLGDSFLKEKSVNDLLSNGSGKLENKLSNSPVVSIQGAIGINDRYQYIRELFNGDADNFVKTVTELDQLNNIQEAVSYLQQNYRWKKNETSLKFVNLVKRRFPNG